VLEGPDAGPFLKDFLPFQRRVARVGVVHSLAQTLLKLTSPGVPDLYRGSELWDLSLVDPANRRAVDYSLRASVLRDMRDRLARGIPRAELAAQLFASPADGAIKLYLTATVLNHRRENLALYAQGAYRPLEAEGERKANVVAFARQREGRYALALAPRLVAGCMGDDALIPPIGPAVWGQTCLLLPDTIVAKSWRNLLTDTTLEVADHEGRASISLAEAFDVVPLALLVSHE